KDGFYRISARALRNRGLITVSGRGPSWTAQVTGAGTDYLKNAADSKPPISSQANDRGELFEAILSNRQVRERLEAELHETYRELAELFKRGSSLARPLKVAPMA